MKIKIGTMGSFCAAHRLPNYPGDCRNLHGHTWKLYIEVSGPASMIAFPNEDDIYPGMLCDFREVDKLLKTMLSKFDHKNLNDIIDVPTAENLLFNEIVPSLMSGVRGIDRRLTLASARLYESEKHYAEIIF